MQSGKPWNTYPSFSSYPFIPNLNNYFNRIKYTGDREPTLENLRSIHKHHLLTISFGNIDVQTGKGISLEPNEIEDKLVVREREGYCFEQNSLFFYVLKALGYKVKPLIARTRWKVPDDVTTGFTHLILKVDIDEKSYLTDVGFGSMILTGILEIGKEKGEEEQEQLTSHDTRRIILTESGYLHQVRFYNNGNDSNGQDMNWLDCYLFNDKEVLPIDCEMNNWWTSTYPNSKFVKNLIVTKVEETCRYALLNTTLTIRHIDGKIEKIDFQKEEIKSVLSNYFGINIDSRETFQCFR